MSETNSKDRFAAGSFGCHEALHMAYVFHEMIDKHLANHPSIQNNPLWAHLASSASSHLYQLYQAIGAVHLDKVGKESE